MGNTLIYRGADVLLATRKFRGNGTSGQTNLREDPDSFLLCAAYYRKTDKQKIAEAFHAHLVAGGTPSPPWDYNVAPTTIQPIIRNKLRHQRARTRLDPLGPDSLLYQEPYGRQRHQ